MKIFTSCNPITVELFQLVDGVIAAFDIGINPGHPLWVVAFMVASIWCVVLGTWNLAS